MFFEKTKFIINKCTRDPNLALHADQDKTNKTSKNFHNRNPQTQHKNKSLVVM
jgi:hypothetical protein